MNLRQRVALGLLLLIIGTLVSPELSVPIHTIMFLLYSIFAWPTKEEVSKRADE